MPRHPNAPPEIIGPIAELRWWPWEPLAKYPHLRPDEAALMDRLLRLTPGMMTAVTYDAAIGPEGCALDSSDLELQLLNRALTRCRLDALAWDGQSLWIIELKTFALPTAVGQVLVYACLLRSEAPGEVPIAGAVLANAAHAATVQCGRSLSIAVVLVESDGLRVLTADNSA